MQDKYIHLERLIEEKKALLDKHSEVIAEKQESLNIIREQAERVEKQIDDLERELGFVAQKNTLPPINKTLTDATCSTRVVVLTDDDMAKAQRMADLLKEATQLHSELFHISEQVVTTGPYGTEKVLRDARPRQAEPVSKTIWDEIREERKRLNESSPGLYVDSFNYTDENGNEYSVYVTPLNAKVTLKDPSQIPCPCHQDPNSVHLPA